MWLKKANKLLSSEFCYQWVFIEIKIANNLIHNEAKRLSSASVDMYNFLITRNFQAWLLICIWTKKKLLFASSHFWVFAIVTYCANHLIKHHFDDKYKCFFFHIHVFSEGFTYLNQSMLCNLLQAVSKQPDMKRVCIKNGIASNVIFI